MMIRKLFAHCLPPSRAFAALGALCLLAGCSDSGHLQLEGTSSPERISEADDPARVLPGVSARLADNLVPADVGGTFGVADDAIPYPDTYWPFTDDGIDARWSSGPSPLEKYMALVSPSETGAAKDWEHRNHGAGVPNVAGWWGHCPGWTGAAISNRPILHPVHAKLDPSGAVRACAPTEEGCVNFEIGDINALEAEIYLDGDSSFAGARCDTKPEDIERDRFGRIVNSGSGCKGINAGALVVLLGNQMKARHLAMAIDAQNDFNTDQIWNQPAYRYTVNRFEPITAEEAVNLVSGGRAHRYLWDARAAGFARVDITISWVSEYGPNTQVVSGLDSTRQTRFVAVLELDAPASNPDANIIGGEYLDDPSVGADRLTVPPFVWVSNGPGPEELPRWVGGQSHNPFVRTSVVEQLIELGARKA